MNNIKSELRAIEEARGIILLRKKTNKIVSHQEISGWTSVLTDIEFLQRDVNNLLNK